MSDWRDSEMFDASDRLVLELAESLTLDNRVEDSLYADSKRASAGKRWCA
jgi:hypothetical protein